jgi:predicted ArsR family transcriptional regulator
VTARRYLEYLVEVDEAIVEAPPAGPGRPSKLYSLAADGMSRDSRARSSIGHGLLATARGH